MMNSWLVAPIGLVDVTSRYQFRAAGLSMVVTPERKMSACSLSPGKNLALVAVMWVWMLKWLMSTASTSLCDFLPWVRLGAVGHEVVAVPHIDGLLGQRVPAAVRAYCMRLVVVAGQRETES